MKSTTQTSLFIFFLCIIVYAPLPAISISLYESLCNEYNPSINIKLCLKILKTDPKITSATNYHDLSEHILYMVLNNAAAVQLDYFEKRKLFPTDPALNSCVNEFYETIINELLKAVSLLPSDPKTARESAIAAGFGANKCQKAFENPEEKNVRAAVHLRNNEMYFLCVIASLSIFHLM
ncbi:putative pectinesterase inhibitor domain-containing protein [Medicago truncatula]|uniref:Plant invertase/pectin methylesterase inhibitor protein n=1 Tax=Medicago truncatula TaxID=3880 RepID=A0A072UJJ4_MEDTR|nr:plant invertase/pectin methylesterase inhibitor protein [Medicago truncatula]RHN51159.1 putative pectinesterase inhibitor domain-containing protein [Medicago truncatula]